MDNELRDKLKCIINEAKIGLLLLEQERYALLYTMLELLFIEAQDLPDWFIVEDENGVSP